MVFEQYSAPAIAAQPARLLVDWLGAYVGLVSRWRVDYFEAHGPSTATIRYYRRAERRGCS
jgi:hypothetical protein